MRLLTKTTFAALLLGTSLAAPVLADNAATAGCGMAAHRTDAEGGGWQPAPGTAVRRTDAEGGGWQPAPGSAPSPGPMVVPAERLRQVLGVTSVNFTSGNHHLAIVDTPLS